MGVPGLLPYMKKACQEVMKIFLFNFTHILG